MTKVEAYRASLERLINGNYKRCIPVQHDDDDIMLLRALDELEVVRERVEQLNNVMDGFLNIAEDKNISAHDVFVSLKQENEQLLPAAPRRTKHAAGSS